MKASPICKEEIVALVQACTTRLGHAPTVAEFHALVNVTKRQVRKNFGSHTRMLAASGVTREGSGYPVSTRSLFLDWAGIVRTLGRIPTVIDYEQGSRYSVRPLSDRFGSWHDVAEGMLESAREEGLEEEWKDVLDIAVLHRNRPRRLSRTSGTTFATAMSFTSRPRSLDDRPEYGQPLPHAPLSYAPTNEAGVVLLFGALARQLGFVVMRVQSEFPDCEALREVGQNRWQRVRIEFEYESHSFLTHMHPVEDCDLIVCWRHNWPDCPLEVLELEGVVSV